MAELRIAEWKRTFGSVMHAGLAPPVAQTCLHEPPATGAASHLSLPQPVLSPDKIFTTLPAGTSKATFSGENPAFVKLEMEKTEGSLPPGLDRCSLLTDNAGFQIFQRCKRR